MQKRVILSMAAAMLVAVSTTAQTKTTKTKKTPEITFSEPYKFEPNSYVCYRAPHTVHVDGQIYTNEWEATPWTTYFVDIQGDNRPETPRYSCRAKLMWDDKYLYIAAEMQEPHLWATLTERESVIFQDNDFEVFLDVNGTTHNYVEYEVNALGTEWDLLLTKPYRDGAAPLNCWNMNGMKSAVSLYGTLNDPTDTDEKWTFEMAIPISSLIEVRGMRGITPGEQWRLNFSRVQWQLEVKDGKYSKVPGTPEDNWVWSPTGKISIHEPEYWGFLQFSDKKAGSATEPFVWNPNEDVKWALRKLYFRQREFRSKTGRWASTPKELKADDIKLNNLEFAPMIYLSGDSFKITAPGYNDTSWQISTDGYVGAGR